MADLQSCDHFNRAAKFEFSRGESYIQQCRGQCFRRWAMREELISKLDGSEQR
ncbi:Hypothetical predicted protein, partial [Paramuricea clavata]